MAGVWRVLHRDVPHDFDNAWIVQKDSGEQASSTHATKREAVRAGKQYARNGNGTLIIHDSSNKVQRSWSPS